MALSVKAMSQAHNPTAALAGKTSGLQVQPMIMRDRATDKSYGINVTGSAYALFNPWKPLTRTSRFGCRLSSTPKKPNAPAHGHGLCCGWKNRYEWSDVSMNWGGWSPFPATNFRYMRYAEVLLSAAEANFNTGQQSKALEYVNLVRGRFP